MDTKAQGISVNVIIIAAIALLVLVILSVIFIGRLGGFGAEVGISTNKIHARGPVGLEGLMIYKYRVTGNGHIVSEYAGKNAKKFLHKKEV